MMSISRVQIAGTLCKQVAELADKPSDGSVRFNSCRHHCSPLSEPVHSLGCYRRPMYSSVVIVAGTPYENGVFHCVLRIDEEFPQKPPKGYFLTKIFHPNVSSTGEICVNTLKKDWDPKRWSLRHILQVIRCLLIVPFPESSLNQEAGKLFMESYDEYAKTARVYCSVYAKKRTKGAGLSENVNEQSRVSTTGEKSEEVLGSLTLNPQSEEKKAAKPANKTYGHSKTDKKKWIKRIC
eukprot:TRINITY_DN5279_c0_g1_i1.p2 TRINITY_DN5279_c0_g1~~TRINITY_DN5279_c0_g1_i1.p2  ORF type:complete len:237 (-),score=52.72 TRINITY_DN5279_c0_g1_i1:89-799(-)